MNIRLAVKSIQTDSIVDGIGIRAVLWTQGCPHNCKGCHNPETHSFTDGFVVNVEAIKKQLDKLKNHDGITFSGGDPMCQPEACCEIAKYAKSIGLNVWCYTGYTINQLNEKQLDFLKYIDVLVDGEFVLEEKSYNLRFKGSKNQRVIDINKTRETREICIVPGCEGEKELFHKYEKPEGIF